jgi:hypothetical protein
MLQAFSTTAVYGHLMQIPVTMRATPSVSQSGTFRADNATSGLALSGTIGGLGANTQSFTTNGWSGGSGLTAGHASAVQGASGAKLIASAEL